MTHVAIDLDDVTVDFVNGMLASYELEFGERIVVGEGGTWGPAMTEFFSVGTDTLAAAGYRSAWAWLREREWLWAQFPAVPGAIGGITTLRAQGHYVEAVTSKPKWAEHNVWKWLGRWRPPFNRVTIVNSAQRKVDLTDARIIVDDKLATCQEFDKAGRFGVWFDRYGGTAHPRLATNWIEVVYAVNDISEQEGLA
jgi:hypothetical protein